MANVKSGVKGFVKTQAPEERFWSKVDVRGGEECWPWLGAHDGRGYGQFWFNGRTIRATRYSWSIHFGKEFPNGMEACHRCDNPNCVNPHHIWPGTHSENLLDASAKGRIMPKEQRKKAAAMTHCKRGHEFTPENICLLKKAGRKCCLICKKANDKARWDKNRAMRVAAGEKVYHRRKSTTPDDTTALDARIWS